MTSNKIDPISLEIPGARGHRVDNKFYQHEEAVDKFAVIFPGLGYTCDKPMLYYTSKLLLARGYDVLQLWTDYNDPAFDELPRAEQTFQLIEDGKALLAAGLQVKNYSNLLLAGKSLGTLTMTFIISEDLRYSSEKTIWFTPLMHLPPVSRAILDLSGKAFVAGSDSDLTYESQAVADLQSNTNVTTLTIRQANHSLEIPGDPIRSIQIISQVMAQLAAFLS